MNQSSALHAPMWDRLLALPSQPGLSLQARLRAAVVQAILDGRLSAGAALPSSRHLAQTLHLSRNTVVAAYQQLVDEGYLVARARSGVFVSERAQPEAAPTLPPTANPFAALAADASLAGVAGGGDHAPRWAARLLRPTGARPTLAKPADWQRYPYPFVYGRHDGDLFPTEDFRECCVQTLTRAMQPDWAPDLEREDVPALIEQIRRRLLPRRGVFASADEVLITVGAQHAYTLLAEALFDRDTRVGLEDPGHPHARNSFALRGASLVDVAVDEDGLVIDCMPPLDYVFVTPSHQSPTTHTMSLERRHWLLRKAELNDMIVLEDDYEAENLYSGTPMPALKSLDRWGRVIYIGSLSKSLSPALRLGYIVAPRELIAELRGLRHVMLRHPSAFLQHAYALFLSLGHHDSHARRVNDLVRQRLHAVDEALQRHLPQARYTMPQGGASIWLRLPDGADGEAVAHRAQAEGVLVEPGAVFFAQPPSPCPWLRLRVTSIEMPRIDAGIAALARAVRAVWPGRPTTQSATVESDSRRLAHR